MVTSIIMEDGLDRPYKSHTYYTKLGKEKMYGILDESSSLNFHMSKQPDLLEQEILLQH